MHALAGLTMIQTSVTEASASEFRFPSWVRVAAPSAVALVFGAVTGWAVWGRGLGVITWLAFATVVGVVAAEAHKRSMAIVVTSAELIERDLFGQRVLPLAHLERARLYRNTRLWFWFRGEAKPVW